jgi:hypothetical protein
MLYYSIAPEIVATDAAQLEVAIDAAELDFGTDAAQLCEQTSAAPSCNANIRGNYISCDILSHRILISAPA